MAAIGGFYGGFWDTGEQEAVLGQIFQAQQDRGAVLSGKAWGNQTGVAAGGMAQNHLSARKSRKQTNASGNGGVWNGEQQFFWTGNFIIPGNCVLS